VCVCAFSLHRESSDMILGDNPSFLRWFCHTHQPASPQNHLLQPPLPPQMGTIDPKSPLAEILQFAPWPLHYRAVTPPKYYGKTDPRKFRMCYEAAIASAADKIRTASILADPPSCPFDLKSDVPAMFGKESRLPSRLERLSVSSIDASNLFPRIA
jgi:hypothetical protein